MSMTKYVGENEGLDPLFEIREIDAWAEGEDGWTWNDTFLLKRIRSASDDLKGLFLRVLRDIRGTPLANGVFYVDDSDWNVIEVKRRKDGCPIWAMIRITPR